MHSADQSRPMHEGPDEGLLRYVVRLLRVKATVSQPPLLCDQLLCLTITRLSF